MRNVRRRIVDVVPDKGDKYNETQENKQKHELYCQN
jgi:hypothetical protein